MALVVVALLPLTLACDPPTAPEVPGSAVRFDAPARYALWWRVTQACSGRTGDLGAVTWYYMRNTRTLSWQGQRVDAYWIGDPDRVVIADSMRNDGPTIRHEMLHVLLQRNGHPRDAYLESCGGVVACNGACALEAGLYGSPAANALELPARTMDTRVDVFAPLPSEVSDSGAAAVMITIDNPRPEPIWVGLSVRESGDLQYPTFGAVADFDDPTKVAKLAVEWWQSSRFPLGAGERRRWVWDVSLPPGRYGILGYFNADTLPRQVISIGQ